METNISKDDILFNTNSENNKGRSCYGWIGKGYSAFYNYYLGYKKAFECLYNEYVQAQKSGQIDIEDTIVYPMCYMMRHMTELFIKFLYLKYSQTTDEEKKHFLNLNHDINSAWTNEVKPILQLLSEDQKLIINFDAIDSYIKQISAFDEKSFKMRYPCDKKLLALNDRNESLNLNYLYSKINNFFLNLELIDYKLNGNIYFWEIDEKEKERLLLNAQSVLGDLKTFIKLLKNEDKLIYKSDNNMIDFSDIPYDHISWFEEPLAKFLLELEEDKLKTIILLYYSARDVLEGRCILSKVNPLDDFLKVIQSNIDELDINNETSRFELIEKITGTRSELLKKRIEFILKIIQEKNNG